MNGQQHYRQAEQLLRSAEMDLEAGDGEGNHREHDQQVARAQVHATLALVAATSGQDCTCGLFEGHDRTCPAGSPS